MSRNDPGEDVAISLDGRPPNWATTNAICWGSKSANSIATVWRRCYSGGARYPIISIEDPFAEDDLEGFQRFTAAVNERVQVIGDDLLGTNAARVREKLRDQSANAVLIKVNQAGTVSDAVAACNEGRRAGFGTMVSASAGETEDTSIVHLAIGWGAGQPQGRLLLAFRTHSEVEPGFWAMRRRKPAICCSIGAHPPLEQLPRLVWVVRADWLTITDR
jgi:enolase